MAIAYGSITNGAGGAARTTLSWTSPVVSGTDTIGIVSFYTEPTGGGSGDLVTGVTWDGVAMTLGKKQLRGNNIGFNHIWYIINPSAGTKTVTVTTSSSSYIDGGFAQYYTGASQTGQPDASISKATSTTNTITQTITTVADNCWVVMGGISDNGGVSAGAGMTTRASQAGAFVAGDSNSAKTPAGSYSMTMNGTGFGNQTIVMLSISPSASAAATPSTLMLTGIGI